MNQSPFFLGYVRVSEIKGSRKKAFVSRKGAKTAKSAKNLFYKKKAFLCALCVLCEK
jgi:hypothetical protein